MYCRAMSQSNYICLLIICYFDYIFKNYILIPDTVYNKTAIPLPSQCMLQSLSFNGMFSPCTTITWSVVSIIIYIAAGIVEKDQLFEG